MGLKEKFIVYCELQNAAHDCFVRYGSSNQLTFKAYEKANIEKRKVLDMIEELEK